VSFGNASGPLPPVSSSLLAQKGSLFFTRPRAADWVRTRAELQASSTTVFEWLGNGVILPVVQQRIPLSRAADAHRLLEARGTTGSLVLVPDEESARVVEVAPQTARGTR
jgi:NADPH2:quinone reductase